MTQPQQQQDAQTIQNLELDILTLKAKLENSQKEVRQLTVKQNASEKLIQMLIAANLSEAVASSDIAYGLNETNIVLNQSNTEAIQSISQLTAQVKYHQSASDTHLDKVKLRDLALVGACQFLNFLEEHGPEAAQPAMVELRNLLSLHPDQTPEHFDKLSSALVDPTETKAVEVESAVESKSDGIDKAPQPTKIKITRNTEDLESPDVATQTA